MRLQGGQDLGAKAPDLLHEHLGRHDAAVKADDDGIGAAVLGLVDYFGDRLRCRVDSF